MTAIITPPMRAFHADPAIKAKYTARVKAHQVADEIVKSNYWDGHRGCAVGCTLHSDNHAAYETEIGIPRSIAYLQDGLFESLPLDEAKHFPLQFLEAVPVGADLSMVTSRFLLRLFTDPKHGGISQLQGDTETTKRCREAVEAVAELLRRQIAGDQVTSAEWNEAASRAEASRAEASRAASWAEASWAEASWAEASWAASRAEASWAEASRAASRAASWAASRAASRAEITMRHRDWLLELLREAPIPEPIKMAA